MIIGIDFDNTLVSYDRLFHQVCRERNLIPDTIPQNKSDVRNYLRRIGQEDVWTELQGYVYGARMAEADPFPGALEFIRRCRDAGVHVHIISHKTRYPFKGERYDLHKAAIDWLERHGLFDPAQIGLSPGDLFLELTREAKLERIATCRCDVFIDDLPELLHHAAFPPGVRPVLFDPNQLYRDWPLPRIIDWAQAWEIVFDPRASAGSSASTSDARFSKFLQQHGFNPTASLRPIAGGGNNRVFRVDNGPSPAVLKVYYQNPADPRDRFGAERAFYTWIVQQQSGRTPEPIGWEPDQRLGLLSFVEGRKLTAAEIGQAEVSQALEFVVELNQARSEATAIAAASEACFTIEEHLQCVDRRIQRFEQIRSGTELEAEATQLVRTELQPLWGKLRSQVITQATAAGVPPQHPLAPDQRCLSPSDFGFHNALLPADGRLRFFDFEYAGWDDPAKLICDFFCQPQVPVPLQHWDFFVETLESHDVMGAGARRRAEILFPVYQLKWCCILLNEFVPSDRARRDFAGESGIDRKRRQLEKARGAIVRLSALHA